MGDLAITVIVIFMTLMFGILLVVFIFTSSNVCVPRSHDDIWVMSNNRDFINNCLKKTR